ncbi:MULTISPECIES: hypothetical protein [Okeania]|uniref:hypothetical protein n=1 Tax=Okeania TaxID=1458928 RepID=UPI000F53552D|nr:MULTISPECIES: hypothetical protein [Okeania]NET78537.1 hypothetical protein [Okeania sp. SIO1F9]
MKLLWIAIAYLKLAIAFLTSKQNNCQPLEQFLSAPESHFSDQEYFLSGNYYLGSRTMMSAR